MKRLPTIALALLLVLPSAAQSPDPGITHRVFLIADSGGFNPETPEPLLGALRAQLMASGDGATVVFLGDNVYPRGIPDSASSGFPLASARLRQQLDAVMGTGARIIVVPGNHDWDDSGPEGLEAVRRQERLVESWLGDEGEFLPDDGLPGPVTVELADDVELVVIDTEWWLRTSEKGYGDAGRYETREEGDLLANLADVLRRKDDSRVLLAAHHPLKSNGRHGGRFPLKEHLFPLTALKESLWIPLPLIGSLYPLAVGWIGGPQDLAHWRYQSLADGLAELFETFENTLVYASGHDHSLQHFPSGHVDYIIAGSSSRPSYVGAGRGAAFTSSEPGFLEVVYRDDGSSALRAHGESGLLHQSELQPARPDDTDLPSGANPEGIGINDPFYTGAAEPGLAAGPLKRALLGSAHRDAWTTRITVPVLDVQMVHGGLSPVQRGGGQQTVSLRLETSDGLQFVLRSLTKDPVPTLPLQLRKTFARNIVLDQVSILHPFGALLVPPLADAAGVYHATPRLYFVPDDPALEPYSDIVGGRIMMMEERPDGDMSHQPRFGSAEDVVGASKMYSEITGDNDHRVDQRFFARNRVLDMYMSDWDRHQDQWRWAALEPSDGQGKIYRPIPRDRDWAFNRMNGLFPTIVQSQLVLPKFQEFKRTFGFIPGLNFNGMPQDRRLTSGLTPADWVEIADSVSAAITDSVIAESLSRWPPEIQALQADEFREIFQARREGLPEAVATYSRYLDAYVDIVMSDKHEEFVLSLLEGGDTEVVVYKTTREGERRKELYRRRFQPGRTRELRLYGMGGDDRFHVGAVSPGIQVHVIGGTGSDAFHGTDATPRTVHLYDTRDGLSISTPGQAHDRRSADPRVNRYDPHEYRFNVVLPSILIGANEDDGLFLGGGPVFHRHRFRALPVASRHRIRANSAARFGAYNVLYDGLVTGFTGGWDLQIVAEARSPNSIRNYFGLGNDTPNTRQNRQFYQARLSEYRVAFGLSRRLSTSSHIGLGPRFEAVEVSLDPDRFISQAGVSPSSFRPQLAAGLSAEFVFDSRDSPVMPARGLRWSMEAVAMGGLNQATRSYRALEGQVSLYLSGAAGSRNTLALRAGFDHRWGEFPFYAAATLGGTDNLRGWRGTRFAGRTATWQNLELRTRLARFAGFVAQGQLGALVFADQGRVWTDGQESDTWHRGTGFGFWLSLFDAAVLSGSVGFSSEQRHFLLTTGFQF